MWKLWCAGWIASQKYTLCKLARWVKHYTMCKLAHWVTNYTQSIFFHVPSGKFYTWLKTFTQPAVVMVVINMRCAHWTDVCDYTCLYLHGCTWVDMLTYTRTNIPVGWIYGAKIADGGVAKVRHANLRSDARGLWATSANCPPGGAQWRTIGAEWKMLWGWSSALFCSDFQRLSCAQIELKINITMFPQHKVTNPGVK